MKKLTKKQKDLIARIYAGSMLMQIDGGVDPDELGISEKDYSDIINLTIAHGDRILKGNQQFVELTEIVNYAIGK